MAWISYRFKSGRIRDLVTVTSALLALPLGWGAITGLLIWLSPFIMLNSVLVLKSFVLLNLAGISVLIIAGFRERFFCKYLCPAGCLQDKVASLSSRGKRTQVKIPRLGAFLALLSLSGALAGFPFFLLLDPLVIFYSFFSVFTGQHSLPVIFSLAGLPVLLAVSFFSPNLWCTKLCPLGGLQDLAGGIGKWGMELTRRQAPVKSVYDPARRFIIISGLGLAAGFISNRITGQSKPGHLRPPASADPGNFNLLCIRCGNCVKSCPTGIIRQHTDPGDLLSWMTPEVIFENGYCLETCNNCSRVCPTGSITLFSPEAKKNIKMGYAEVNYEGCLLAKNSECDRCLNSCKYDAISIEPLTGSLNSEPVIDTGACTGCGACVVICPTRVITVLAGTQV
jgi:ferredoxin-type protein NapF